jgi:hypothetical protein
MKILLCVLFLNLSLSILAQDSTSSKNNQIQFKPFSRYNMNGHRLSEKQLKTELYKVPAAIPFYKKAKTQKITGCLLFIGGAASFALSDNNVLGNSGRRINAGAIVGFTAMAVSFPILLSSFKQLKKSIAIHNETRRLTY